MEHVAAAPTTPPFDAPDAENVFEALARLQTLSWMQRPVVIRSWVDGRDEGATAACASATPRPMPCA